MHHLSLSILSQSNPRENLSNPSAENPPGIGPKTARKSDKRFCDKYFLLPFIIFRGCPKGNSAFRYNHPELLIKKLQVLGKGFYPQIGNFKSSNNPLIINERSYHLYSSLIRGRKNFSQSFCFSKRQVRFYSCLILKEITEFLLSKIGMYLLDFLRFFRISGEEVTVGLLGCD